MDKRIKDQLNGDAECNKAAEAGVQYIKNIVKPLQKLPEDSSATDTRRA
jgi:hypothetical protein